MITINTIKRPILTWMAPNYHSSLSRSLLIKREVLSLKVTKKYTIERRTINPPIPSAVKYAASSIPSISQDE